MPPLLTNLRARIASLSPRTELALVIGLTFGLQFGTYLFRVSRIGFQSRIQMSEGRLLALVAIEVALALLLGSFLYVRGWRLGALDLRVTARTTLVGVRLWLASYLLYAAAAIVVRATLGPPRTVFGISFHGQVGLPVIALVCAVNPLFEELLCLAYLMRVLKPRGPVLSIGVSTFLRLLAHTYQGPFALVSILPLGLLFAVYFRRTERLWPPVFAHVIADFIGLSSLMA